MKKKLQTLYLRHDSSSRSLTKRALAQLVLKLIFSFEVSPGIDQIIKDLNEVLNTSIKSDKIEAAIDLLIIDHALILRGDGKYEIEFNKRKHIEDACNEFKNRQNRIVDKYFKDIKTEKNYILNWFEDVTLEIFNQYSVEWVSDLCNLTKDSLKNKKEGIQEILDKVTNKNKNIHETDKEWIKQQYFKFIQTTEPDVTAILWDYGTSSFSSTLITADISADPITVDEFKNSKCILDTNILMYLDLEASQFKTAFESLEKIFEALDITPMYFSITRDEFTRSIQYKKELVLRIVDNYSMEVFEETNDPLLNTAIQRGCAEKSDFETFFGQLLDIPDFFSNSLRISNLHSSEVEEAIKKGQGNEKLKEHINEIYKNKTNRNKRKNATNHDAGLISGVEHIRNGEKCFILSRDNSINELALGQSNPTQIPVSISLDTLINLFAIDNGGVDIDPTNYAPLFANIIKLELNPEKDIFKLEDLSRMLDVQTQIADLPHERIIAMAKEVHHNKILGISDDEIALQLTRGFQSAKLELVSDLDKSRREAVSQKEEKEKFIEKSDKAVQILRDEYTSKLRDKYDLSLKKNKILVFIIFPIVTIAIFGGIIYIEERHSESLWIHEAVNLGVHLFVWFIVDFFFLNKKINSKYSERVNGISKQVEERINKEISS